MAEIPRLMADLTNKQDRLTMLQRLTNELNAEERNALSLMQSRKNGPLAVLPIEIIIQIASYLHILDTWKLQLVSKQWRSVFSADQLIKTSTARWNTHDPSDSALTSESAKGQSIETKIRHMQALRHGRSFASTMILFQYPQYRTFPLPQARREFALKGHRIAYIETTSEETDYVIVRDLVTGEEKRCHGFARESIRAIALTTRLLAFLNHQGRLYVQSLSHPGSEVKQIQLPSASISAFAADEDIVAMVFHAWNSGGFTTALYDHSRGSLKGLDIICPTLESNHKRQFASPQMVLVNAQHATFDLFSTTVIPPIGNARSSDVYIHHRRISFTGSEICSSEYKGHHTILDDTMDDERQYPAQALYGDIHPTGDRDMYVLRINRLRLRVPHIDPKGVLRPEEDYKVVLMFNARTAKLEEHLQFCEQPFDAWRYDSAMWKDLMISCTGKYLRFRTERDPPITKGEIEAKHVAKYLPGQKHEQPPADTDISNNRTDISTPPVQSFLDHNDIHLDLEYKARQAPNEPHYSNYTAFVNESFVVAVGQAPGEAVGTNRRIHVFCFDEDLQCEGFQEPQRKEGEEEGGVSPLPAKGSFR